MIKTFYFRVKIPDYDGHGERWSVVKRDGESLDTVFEDLKRFYRHTFVIAHPEVFVITEADYNATIDKCHRVTGVNRKRWKK